MSGTKLQTSETVLQELILYWPGYTIVGSKPYNKGAKIYKTYSIPTTVKYGSKLVQTFSSNEVAFLIMSEAIAKGTGWYPGVDVESPLFGSVKISEATENLMVSEARRVFYNDARKAKDIREKADLLFSYIGIDPLDTQWKSKINKILKIRRNDTRRVKSNA